MKFTLRAVWFHQARRISFVSLLSYSIEHRLLKQDQSRLALGSRVSLGVLLDGVLALGKGVPQLDGPVAGARHDLPVVGGEGHAEDLLGVALEAASAVAGAQVPQPQGVIPRAGQSEVTVGGQDDVRDEVPVTSQPLLGVA